MSTDTVVLFRPADFLSWGILHFGKLLADETPPKNWEVVAHFVASFARETLSIKQCVLGIVVVRVYEHLTEPFTDGK